MPKLLQINITANWGSHGKIAEGIGRLVQANGWESYIAYGRNANPSLSILYHIGSQLDEMVHGLGTRLFDNHGLMSKLATRQLVKYIEKIQPDIIHLHNIHGYFINYPILFKYLSTSNIPVVWTLHDCWTYTGHCAHYMYAKCDKWKSHCGHCPQKGTYPKSVCLDLSYRNYELKRKFFLSIEKLTLVPVCKWQEQDLKQSFFQHKSIIQIYNGIDTELFKPQKQTKFIRDKYHIPTDQRVILGVASNWYRKGLTDFIQLRSFLPKDFSIVVVGLNSRELIKIRHTGIIGIKRTENVNELIALYSTADVYFNPTWEDNFPTTNLEAMACGTPTVTYQTGGSPESITDKTGRVIPLGNIPEAVTSILAILNHPKSAYTDFCVAHVANHFNKVDRFSEYFELYNKILAKKQ